MGNISSNISAFQSLHIVMLGLDSAGKTTVLYRLKFNEFVNTVPTIGFNTEKIRLSNGTAKGISCHFWDVGGQEKLQRKEKELFIFDATEATCIYPFLAEM
uniref:ARF like GTPase 4C n=1 Tax=Serinus canaria TaxID=9135 RepID=A0A8C9N5V8_SERCA